MTKTRKKTPVILSSVLVLLLLSFTIVANAQTVMVQLCLILDGSGSVLSSNWTIIVNGVADAVENVIPTDGSVELTVIQFGHDSLYAVTEIPPTVITDANVQTVANNIRTIPYDDGGWTPTAHAIYLGWYEMNASQHFPTAERQVINLVTDGMPNARNNNATIDEDGDTFIDYWDDVIAAKNISVSQGLDELDMEGIGISDLYRDWFKTWVVYPSPGHLAPDEGYIPGWIRVVATAADFAPAISEKFETLFEPVGGTIIPTSGLITLAPWLLLAAAIVLAVSWRIRKKVY